MSSDRLRTQPDSRNDNPFQDDLDTLRRAIVRVSVAAEGLDPDLDKQLDALRSGLRDGRDNDALNDIIQQMEQSIIQLDDRRRTDTEASHALIQSRIEHYLELDLPRPSRKQLKSLSKQLPDMLGHAHRQADLVEQLTTAFDLINDIKSSTPSDKPEGFMARLFNPSNGNHPPRPPSTADIHDPKTDDSEHFLLERLSRTLSNLLEHLDIPPEFIEQREALVHRVKTELELSSLPELLDELAQLVASIKLAVQKELQHFLLSLHDRLNDVQSFLLHAREGEARSRKNQETLDRDVRQELQDIQIKLEGSEDVVSMKADINLMVERISTAVNQFQEQESQRREAMHAQFEHLSQRITLMESEASTLKTTLESQRREANRDALTGLPNRSAYDVQIKSEYSRWRRHGHSLSIAIIDIDNFKSINDNLGHLRGDRVLKLVAREISMRVREEDMVSRYGGEEFVVIMPETDLQSAMAAMEKVRASVQDCPFSFNQQRISITASFGLATFIEGDDIEACFERADKALYAAKQNGRNRIERG